MHSKSVVHRDLKLENLLLARPNDITSVKITDFGLAKDEEAEAMISMCGTPHYVAPEILQVRRRALNHCTLRCCRLHQ